jgi:hypothetical protein
VFVVGGTGPRRCKPLSYQAVARGFVRRPCKTTVTCYRCWRPASTTLQDQRAALLLLRAGPVRRQSVRLFARKVEVFDGPKQVATHERAFGRYVEVLTLDHYLEVLTTKPGGLPGATALVQAKASGAFTRSHQRYWDAVRRARGDGAGTRALVEVLLAHRTMPTAVLIVAMDRAVDTGCFDPQVVLIDGRDQGVHVAPVIPIATLARCDRPIPSLSDYDQLLTARRAT